MKRVIEISIDKSNKIYGGDSPVDCACPACYCGCNCGENEYSSQKDRERDQDRDDARHRATVDNE